MLNAFRENVNVDSVRVYPPRRYVLLCGGEVSNIRDPLPTSLRDAFLRGDAMTAVKNSELLQVEEIQEFFEKDSPYSDLVGFESDIAQVCELVLLFSETPGSFTELGSFTMVEEISEKLLVIIQSKFLSRHSFITKGPIAFLNRKFPNSVFSFADITIGMNNGQVSTAQGELLVNAVSPPIELRLKQVESRTTLDRGKFNHLCKLYVGLLREAYCLKDDEIILLLSEFGFEVNKETLSRVAFCCSALRWSATVTSGFDRVHYAIAEANEATKFEFKPTLLDKIRRRAEFRDYWQNHDPDRVAAVDQALS